MRENLAAAIASCAPYGNNTQELGRLRTVTPIVGYMVSTNPKVHRTTAMALQKLSQDPQNCITMHQVIFQIIFKGFKIILFYFFFFNNKEWSGTISIGNGWLNKYRTSRGFSWLLTKY